MTASLFGQVAPRIPVNNSSLSPTAKSLFSSPKEIDGIRAIVWVNSMEGFEEWLQTNYSGQGFKRVKLSRFNAYVLDLPNVKAARHLAINPYVEFLDIRLGSPIPERAVEGLDLSVNGINLLQQRYPELRGRGMAISIKENAFDSTDIDLRNRYLPSPNRDALVTTHATNVASMAAGDGTTFYTGKGPAPEALISSSSFFNLFPDEPSYFTENGISVQNHSYGVGIENYYGAEAFAYDQQVYDSPTQVHVFSAGNQGDQTSTVGLYREIPAMANLTGTMKMAKNVFVIGSVDSLANLITLSSRGPAYDGRIKPELVTFGQDGSSGAAAITSGVLLLLQQDYRERFGTLPDVSLLRALLFNGADDLAAPGPDYLTGYGNLNAAEAIATLRENKFIGATIGNGEQDRYTITVPPGARQLKITLAWLDEAAAPNSDVALVNDLELEVVPPDGGSPYIPLVLNPFPQIDSLRATAHPGRDHLNNQEQIIVANPAGGEYELRVSSFGDLTGAQPYHLVYDWELEDFQWRSPVSQDPIIAGQSKILRWHNTLSVNTGILSYRYLDADDWMVLDDNLNLGEETFSWSVPDHLGLVQLRMVIEDQEFLTDTLLISRVPELRVAVDCDEELILQWSAEEGEVSYQLYGLGEGGMEPLLTTQDNLITLDKRQFPFEWFALAANDISGRMGVRSQAIKLDFQPAGCYVDQFLGNLVDDEVQLRLSLGSLLNVEEVVFEQLIDDVFVPLTTVRPVNARTLTTIDRNPQQGENRYRVSVSSSSGQTTFSDEVVIFYSPDDYFVYPNPTSAEEGAGLIIRDLPPDATLVLYDAQGRVLTEVLLLGDIEEIPTQGLKSGVYVYQIFSEGRPVFVGRLVIQ